MAGADVLVVDAGNWLVWTSDVVKGGEMAQRHTVAELMSEMCWLGG